MNNICVSGANVNFKAKPIKPANIKPSFVNTSNDFMELSTTKNKSFLYKLTKIFKTPSGAAAGTAAAGGIAVLAGSQDYTNPYELSFPEDDKITFPNGEVKNLTDFVNNNSIEYTRIERKPQKIVVLEGGDKKSEIYLEKYNKTLNKGRFGTKLSNGQRAVLEFNEDGEMSLNTGRLYPAIASESLNSGKSRIIDWKKAPAGESISVIYNIPYKATFIPKGTSINTKTDYRREIDTKEDSILVANRTFSGEPQIDIISVKNFVEYYTPTPYEGSKRMFDKLKGMVKYPEITTPAGNKYEVHGKSYRSGNVVLTKKRTTDNLRNEYYYEYMDLSGEELDKLNKIYKDFIISHPDHKDKKAHMTLLIKDGVFNKNQTFDVYSLYFDNVEPAYMGVYSGNSIIWEQTESQLEFIKKIHDLK